MAITIPELNSVSVVDDTDNIMLTHSNGNSEKISGSAFKADMIKNKIENNNGHAVSINAVSTIMATSTTITGPELGTGGNIKILFTSVIAGVDTSTGLTLTYNGSPIAVKVGKDGALEDFKAVEVSSGVYKFLQAYTTLELIYNGTYFIIVGNPVVLSDTLYCIRANGYQAVDTVASNNMNSVSSNAVSKLLNTNLDDNEVVNITSLLTRNLGVSVVQAFRKNNIVHLYIYGSYTGSPSLSTQNLLSGLPQKYRPRIEELCQGFPVCAYTTNGSYLVLSRIGIKANGGVVLQETAMPNNSTMTFSVMYIGA